MNKLLRYMCVAAVAMVAVAGAGQLQAQITGEMVANVPFPFYVGSAKLPAGKYIIHNVDLTDNALMEIQNADDTTSALFEVTEARTNHPPMKAGVLKFKELKNRYYLRQIFDPDDKYGATALDTGYSKLMKAVGESGGEEKDVSAEHERKPLP